MKIICKRHSAESSSQLKKGGLKVTSARLKIMDIFKHSQKPLNIKQIAARLKGLDIDLVTLYRNVESLKNLGFIKEVRLKDRQAHYELKTEKHHHHIICQNCGKISDIQNCNIDIADPQFLKAHGFSKITDHSLEFFGICKKCK